jgi:hypothetical protein
MRELTTAVWLEAAYQIFIKERCSRVGRKRWFKVAAREARQREHSRVYN